jgi:aminopeptidase N
MLAAALSFLSVFAQDPGPGIDRELARARKRQIDRVRYTLTFRLDPAQQRVGGDVLVEFDLSNGEDPRRGVVLDFDGAALGAVRVNGVGLENARRTNGHVLLPREQLSRGENSFEAEFASDVAATGTPLSSYRDEASGRVYWYTLLVPADAHRLFPCFDQPDLKARFRLRLEAPAEWQVLANAPATDTRLVREGWVRHEFAETEPICTYLFAFAAGDFAVHEAAFEAGFGANPARRMRLYYRPEKADEFDAATLFGMHKRAVDWLATYFDVPYPFAKLDFALVPGFPYGGMEHAGAIFYRESALAFDHEPTASELVRRSTLVYHEVSHQWFGNLASFEWFDDLWLKEGFATFMGYGLMHALEPERKAWLRFLQGVKPAAYRVDATPGTTPIYQALGNLKDAKSAYGAIVYNKAPALLRELEARLGAERFRAGVATFLKRFAFGNAQWRDLVDALEGGKPGKLDAWSQGWILRAGLPVVEAQWSETDGKIREFAVVQRGRGDEEAKWPLRLEVVLERGTTRRRETVELDGARVELPQLAGEPAPDWVLLNPSDKAYGLFLLDARSREALLVRAPREPDDLLRAVMVSALQETVREGDLDPARFADLLLDLLAREHDPDTHATLLDALSTVVRRWISPARGAALRKRIDELLLAQLAAGDSRLVLQVFRKLAVLSASPDALAALARAVAEDALPGSVAIGPEDEYLAFAALVAAGRAESAREHLTTKGDVAKFAYLAGAAAADADVKERYFASYFDPKHPPEQWVQASLGFFHWPGQGELTLPYLRRALDRVEWVKEHRKIFFMPAWIDGFVNGHSTRAALEIVEAFRAAHEDLPADVRRKLLQSLDELQRAVRLQEKWG